MIGTALFSQIGDLLCFGLSHQSQTFILYFKNSSLLYFEGEMLCGVLR